MRLSEQNELKFGAESVQSSDPETDKRSCYLRKNLIVYVIVAILQFSAANATVNLVTSLAGGVRDLQHWLLPLRQGIRRL